MKRTVLITLVTLMISSCLIQEKDTFSLVCSGTENIESSLSGSRKETKTITLNFKNKKLENYDCHTWTDEKIICSLNSERTSTLFQHSVINIDRMSGSVSSGFHESLQNDKGQLISGSITTFQGKCEKVKDKKF